MSHVCRKDMSGFDAWLRLPAEHRDRRDAEDCPRCGSRLLTYQAFMLASDVPGADAVAALKHLTSFIDSESASALPQAAAEKQERRMFWTLPNLRWLLPVAAVVIVAAIGVWRNQPQTDRSPEVRAVGDETGIVLVSPRIIDGVVELGWESVATADAYEVRLLAPDFAELRRIGPVPETSVRVEAADAAYYQVVGLAGGDQVAASPIRRIPAK